VGRLSAEVAVRDPEDPYAVLLSLTVGEFADLVDRIPGPSTVR
jgi:hypothetical protein